MNVTKKNVSADEIQPVETCEARKLRKWLLGTPSMPNSTRCHAGKMIPETTQSDIPSHAAKSPTCSERRRSRTDVAESMAFPLPTHPTATSTGHADQRTKKIATGNKVPLTQYTSTCSKKSR